MLGSSAVGEFERARVKAEIAERGHPIFWGEWSPVAMYSTMYRDWGIADIRDLVADLKKRDIGVLITDHNVRETLEIVDRACIIYDGQVLFAGSPEDLVADPNVRRLYLGEGFAL